MSLFCAVSAVSVGTITVPEEGSTILYLLALVFLCSCFGFTFQPVAQKYMSAEDAGLFCALDPLFATLWSMIFLAEDPGTTGFIGAFLVIAGKDRDRNYLKITDGSALSMSSFDVSGVTPEKGIKALFTMFFSHSVMIMNT